VSSAAGDHLTLLRALRAGRTIMLAYLRHGETRYTAPAMEKEFWWQKLGLTYTASGYGRRIPTRYMVQVNGKWRRVYCCQISNAGTCYIGKLSPDAIIVSDIERG
jgi:hypothetical protein